jgi:uncharacterized protein (TIGR03437 family)
LDFVSRFSDVILPMRFQTTATSFVLALFGCAGPVLAQIAIQGPSTGSPGQVLTYQFTNAGAAQPAVWSQGFNPDRYGGTNYATSFRLAITPQNDGSVQIKAPAPGRYRLLAGNGPNSAAKAILISPTSPAVPIRGLAFWLSQGGFASADVRTEASQRMAVAKHLGINWIGITYDGCLNFDSGSLNITSDPATCYAVAQPDLEWILDEAHSQGYLVALEGGVQETINGGGLTDLQFAFPLLSDVQIEQVQASYIAFQVSLAAIAQKHKVEAMFVGDNWQTSYPGPALVPALNIGWNSLLDQLRAVYSGKIWFGWGTHCAQWYGSELWPISTWQKTDGTHVFGAIPGSGPLCAYPPTTGYNNISAEDMAINLGNRADPQLGGFATVDTTGVPIIWGDFYPVPIDGMNWQRMASSTDPILDFQETVDFFEASMRANLPNKPEGFFPWAMDLHSYNNQNLLAQSAFLHSFANWMGGDTAYFETCLVDQVADVLYQSNFACPVSKYTGTISLTGGADVAPDPLQPSNSVLQVPFGGNAQNSDGWGDFVLTQEMRNRTGDGIAQFAFRIPTTAPYMAYNIQLSSTVLSLTKYNGVGSASTTLGSVGLPANSVGQWIAVGLTAVGSHLTVSLNGKTVIDVTDNAAAQLTSGSANWGICCATTGAAFADYDQIVVHKVSPLPASDGSPFVQSVVSAASYAGSTIAPGEIVTLFGTNMGPSSLAGLQLDQSGKISSSLAGTQVLFDGVPAPIIYTQASQVSVVAPYSLTRSSTQVQVGYQGKISQVLTVATTATIPGIFTADSSGQGQAAALNQDGSYNSAKSPAARGAYLTLFLTGHGAVLPAGDAGAVAGQAAPTVAGQVQVWVGQQPAAVSYAGVAPFSTYGLMQLNLQIPANAPTGAAVPILVGIGNYVTQPSVTVAIQ